jgi:hypothetical protein
MRRVLVSSVFALWLLVVPLTAASAAPRAGDPGHAAHGWPMWMAIAWMTCSSVAS